LYWGTKIISLTIEKIGMRIIDSYNFIQAPLKEFPKAFGLTELRKGYFPFKFDSSENKGFIGPIPDKKYYCSAIL